MQRFVGHCDQRWAGVTSACYTEINAVFSSVSFNLDYCILWQCSSCFIYTTLYQWKSKVACNIILCCLNLSSQRPSSEVVRLCLAQNQPGVWRVKLGFSRLLSNTVTPAPCHLVNPGNPRSQWRNLYAAPSHSSSSLLGTWEITGLVESILVFFHIGEWDVLV